MILRIKTKDSQFKLSSAELPAGTTIGQLLGLIAEKTSIPVARIQIKNGFPPKLVDVSDTALDISSVISSGDSLIVETGPTPAGEVAVQRRRIADDNSCLFNALSYVVAGSDAGRRIGVLERRSSGNASVLRKHAADYILAHPDEYNGATLGKDPKEYSEWIRNNTRWGGGIELSVFAAQLGMELCVMDIQTVAPRVFGEGSGYQERVYLLYDGIHYDALAVGEGNSETSDCTIFPSTDSGTLGRMMGYTLECQQRNDYTDLASFTLRCGQCSQGCAGEKAALEHGKATGHSQFEEYIAN